MRTLIRVAAIIFHKNKLVATKMVKKGSEYYVLPGGGVEDYETIHEAIKREVKEELNIEIITSKLVYIRELNIKDKGRGIEFYFYIKEYTGEPKKGFDPEIKEAVFEDIAFLSLNELNKIRFYPEQIIGQLKEDMERDFSEIKHLGLHNYP